MAPTPAALPDELVEQILVRLPPDEPASLFRASLVCKTWSHALSSPGFRRRLHELHRTPPMLGFLHNWDNGHMPHFIPTTSSSFSLAAPDRRSWRAIDCRHGRALFLSKDLGTTELLVWEPITGSQWRIPVPAASNCRCPTAAVFCAADGCDHRDCQGGPFHLVFVFTEYTHADEYDEYATSVTSACLYSSETGVWGEPTSMHGDFEIDFSFYSGVLVGRSLFYFLSDSALIVEYDLARHGLTVFGPPESSYYDDRFSLMLAEDGGLGLIQALDPPFKLWSRKASDDGTDAQWVSRVICLENLLPYGAFVNAARSLNVLGFAEGANVILVNTVIGLFTVGLQSRRVTKVCDNRHGFCNLIPVVSFYTPVPCCERQDSPKVHCYEKVAPEGASTLKKYGCALLPKAQEAIGPSGKSAPNEESVKSN